MGGPIWSRALGAYVEEAEPSDGFVTWLYGTALGRLALLALFARPWLSNLYAAAKRTRRSARGVAPFAARHHIDLTPWEGQAFSSFEAFFIRETRPLCAPQPGELYAVAQAKLTAHQIGPDLVLTVKGVPYTLDELLDDRAAAAAYAGGVCLVYRLSMTDTHRYLFPDQGTLGPRREIGGVLHTVRPVSARFRVFAHNARAWTVLHTRHFGPVLQMEVGAMLVGRTVEHRRTGDFQALEEKGYFTYGGSSIVQCFAPGRVTLDGDLWQRTRAGEELKVEMGERIGYAQAAECLL